MRIKGNYSTGEQVFSRFIRKQGLTAIPTSEVFKNKDLSGSPLKNFDVLLFSKGLLACDLKSKQFGYKSARRNLWENWVLDEDPRALITWKKVFKKNGSEIDALLVFIYKT